MHFLLYSFITILFSAPLFGMEESEIQKKLNTYCMTLNAPLLSGNTYLYVDHDLIKTIIIPELINEVVTELKYKIIAEKNLNQTRTPIQHIPDELFCHPNGEYHHVPKIEGGFAAWEGKSSYRRFLKITNDPLSYVVARHKVIDPTIYYETAITTFDHAHNIESDNLEKIIVYKKTAENNITNICELTSSVTQHIFNNNGTWLIVGLTDGNVKIYNLETGKCSNFFLNGAINILRSNHHSTALLAGSAGATNNLVLITLKNGIPTPIDLTGHTAQIVDAQFSPDDTRLITCSDTNNSYNSTIQLWNTSNLDTIQLIKIFKQNWHICKVAFNHSGNRVAIASGYSNLMLYDGLTANYIASLAMHHFSGNPWIMLFSRDDTLLITNNKGFDLVSIWSTKNHKRLVSYFDNVHIIKEVGLTSNERSIFIRSTTNGIQSTELYTQEEIDEIEFIISHLNLPQACALWQVYKKFKDSDAVTFVKEIRLLIQKFKLQAAQELTSPQK